MRRRRALLLLLLAALGLIGVGVIVPAPATSVTATDDLGLQVLHRGLAEAFPARTTATAGTTPAATTDARPDPLGDVMSADGQTIEPRADISRLDVSYGSDRIDFVVTVPGGVDPTTSDNFRENFSGIVLVMDVNGDDVPDFGSAFVVDRDGRIQVLTIPAPPAPDPATAEQLLDSVCFGDGEYEPAARSYRLTVPSECIGNAYEVRAAGGILFNRATSISDEIDLTVDLVPNDDDLLGVHRETTRSGAGYRFVAGDGGIFSFGNAGFFGSTGDLRLNQPIVGMETTRSGKGYWLVASDGGVFTFGDAAFLGSTGDLRLNEPIVAMATTPTGAGYWFVARDGGVFTFGDARFFGSASSSGEEIVGMAATPTGRGYWLVGRSGTVFGFGDAPRLGSASGLTGDRVAGITSTPSGRGYWLAFADGGVIARGDAAFKGDAEFLELNAPIVGLASTPTGRGYWLLGRDGGVFSFGDAAFHGSTGDLRLNSPVLDLTV